MNYVVVISFVVRLVIILQIRVSLYRGLYLMEQSVWASSLYGSGRAFNQYWSKPGFYDFHNAVAPHALYDNGCLYCPYLRAVLRIKGCQFGYTEFSTAYRVFKLLYNLFLLTHISRLPLGVFFAVNDNGILFLAVRCRLAQVAYYAIE